jgi:GTP pyrophosphokinase
MLRQYELVERVKAYAPDADEQMLNRAYVYTVQKHGSQKRASGDPYFSHPVEVAGLMTELKLDQDTIITALLHDTVEDTLATIDEVEKLFGPDVARMVDGVTKLSKIEAMSEKERAAENLRKFLLAMSEDLRVLLVKLADRLHNMRTLHYIKSEDKRRRIAKETMDIYAPLAERVGMYEYMREMQLLAFQQLEPEAYATITGRLAQIRSQDHGQVDAIALSISQALTEAGLKCKVWGREKHPIRSGARWPNAMSISTRSPTSWPSACWSIMSRIAIAPSACCTPRGRLCRGGSRTIFRRPRSTAIKACTHR